MDNELKEIVGRLYRLHWNKIGELDLSHFSESQLNLYTDQLCIASGWRERVSAAKLIIMYGFNEKVTTLIASFRGNPEIYTCGAFCEMLERLDTSLAMDYLQKMKDACPNDEYSERLKERIHSTIQKITDS